ncbi:hypothetical protein LPW11_16175 [Geomonas sp. RF6]|uniref:cytochrome c3 family protein n=1 Tax=Geomonas sp. RF6 TaxID=2897342 RepID=UPI001E48DA7E|nr:cytochrome c3 family protein [Geomonas sp. RF6]UFS69425.1 hypothetical protein LPW11_16175 [Geomonas sp. RF6]
MKKVLLTLAIVVALLAAFTLISESSNKSSKETKKPTVAASHGDQGEEATQDEAPMQPQAKPPQGHATGKINCKTCHDCEYPTKENPCLVRCPKNTVSVYHSAEQAPEVLVLNDLSEKYGSVVFTHKVHAQMSEMSHGCNGCHHYNTTGPVLNCKKCHGKERKREDIGTPDLEAAYHRQCMPCHRKWSKSTDCDSCHQLKSAKGAKTQQEKISKATGKTHPRSQEPTRVVYDTTSSTGRYVTFYHNEHVAKFNLPCTGCHKDEKCMRCHEAKTADGHKKKVEKEKAAKADFGTRHKQCSACHDTRNCNTCHAEKVAAPFNHTVNARWDLGKFHSRLSCDRCHGKRAPLKKVDSRCASCHSWKLGSFNHSVTGLSLSKNHQEIDCNSCHPGKDFAKKPVCKECHDDKDFPKALPGKRGGKGRASTSL